MSAEPPDAAPAAPPSDTSAGAPDATPVALARYRVLVPHLYDGVTLKAAAASAGVPYRTAQRWLAAYKLDGLQALARADRSDKGRRRLPEELIAFIEGLALKPPRPTIAKIHRQAVSVAAQRGWPRPGYGSVHDIVTGIDPALQVMAHEGTKRYREVYELVHRREASKPNAI